MKYRGYWVQGEGYGKELENFVGDRKLPVDALREYGLYLQIAVLIGTASHLPNPHFETSQRNPRKRT